MTHTNSKRQFLAGVEDLDVEQAKRKKTVTWAVDGELQVEGEESPLELRGSLSYQALDEIFRDIDETFLAQQGKLSFNKVEQEGLKPSLLSPTPQQSWFKLLDLLGTFLTLLPPLFPTTVTLATTETPEVSRQQLLERRLESIEQLTALYKQEFWSAIEELALKRVKFGEQRVWKDGAAPVTSKLDRLRDFISKLDSPSDLKTILEAHFESLNNNNNSNAVPLYETIEDMVLSLHQISSTELPCTQALVMKRNIFLQHLDVIGRLEQSALATVCREMDEHGALASLAGRCNRFLIKKTALLLGRETEGRGKVDIDLSGEGAGQTVSRRQAQLVLNSEGEWVLRSVGRRSMSVNGTTLLQGQSMLLPHLSFIRVGGVQLLFMVNKAAVDRVLGRSLQGANIG